MRDVMLLVGGIVAFLGLALLIFLGGSLVVGVTGMVALFYGGALQGETFRLAQQDSSRQRRLRWSLAWCQWLAVTAFTAWIVWTGVGARDHLTIAVLGLLWIPGIWLIEAAFAPRALYGFPAPARPSRRAEPAPALASSPPAEPALYEVSEEAARFWSKPHPRLLHAGVVAVIAVGFITGVVTGVMVLDELGLPATLGIVMAVCALGGAIAHGLSVRYDIPLELPPRPPPDVRDAADQLSFRPRMPPLVFLLVPPLAYSLFISVWVFDGPNPPTDDSAPVWLASTGISLALAIAAFVRMLQMRIDINTAGLRVINFWKSRVIPWESVQAIRTGIPFWAGPVMLGSDFVTTAAGEDAGEQGEPPSGLRIFFSEGALDGPASRWITVSATLWCDPLAHPRFQQALATLLKQAHAHGLQSHPASGGVALERPSRSKLRASSPHSSPLANDPTGGPRPR